MRESIIHSDISSLSVFFPKLFFKAHATIRMINRYPKKFFQPFFRFWNPFRHNRVLSAYLGRKPNVAIHNMVNRYSLFCGKNNGCHAIFSKRKIKNVHLSKRDVAVVVKCFNRLLYRLLGFRGLYVRSFGFCRLFLLRRKEFHVLRDHVHSKPF